MKQDRSFVAISAIWYERFLECSRTYGTIEFKNSVWRFYHSLLNLDEDQYAIYNKVKEYVENSWMPGLEETIRETAESLSDPSSIEHEREMIESQYIVEVFHFITQAIQDSGIGWHTMDNVQSFQISQE